MMPFHTGFGPSVRCKIQPPLDIKILSLATTKDKGRDFKEVALPSPTLDKSIFASRNVKKLCSGDSLADLNSFFQKCLANRISTHYQLQITTVSTLPSQRDRVQKTPIAWLVWENFLLPYLPHWERFFFSHCCNFPWQLVSHNRKVSQHLEGVYDSVWMYFQWCWMEFETIWSPVDMLVILTRESIWAITAYPPSPSHLTAMKNPKRHFRSLLFSCSHQVFWASPHDSCENAGLQKVFKQPTELRNFASCYTCLSFLLLRKFMIASWTWKNCDSQIR